MSVATDPLIRRLAGDEALTRELGDVEGRMLIEWLVEWAEVLANSAKTDDEARKLITRLTRRGRAIARFVTLWCGPDSRPAAAQLAAVECFAWPLPTSHNIRKPELMEHVLNWERMQRP